MKGPKFNAKQVQMNQATDIKLARVVATARQAGLNNTAEQLLSNVLRPFMHELNRAQLENADPIYMNEGLASLVASMLVEMMGRVIPAPAPSILVQAYVQDFIEDVNRQIIRAVNNNYGEVLQLADPPPPPSSGTVQ